MFKNTLIVMSRDASVDASDDLLSIFKVVDKLEFAFSADKMDAAQKEKVGKEKVLLPAQFSFTTVWRGEKLTRGVDLGVAVKIMSPNDEELGAMETPIAVVKPSRNIRSIIRFENILVREPGIYRLVAVLKREKTELAEAEVKFEVHFKEAGPQGNDS